MTPPPAVTVRENYVNFNSILQQLALSSFWKLVFISLISYIVCSLQTFLIALIRSAAVRLKISGSDDNTMTV